MLSKRSGNYLPPRPLVRIPAIKYLWKHINITMRGMMDSVVAAIRISQLDCTLVWRYVRPT